MTRFEPHLISIGILCIWVPAYQTCVQISSTALSFSKLKLMFLGYFDPENIFFMMKTNNYWGDLTGISAVNQPAACVPHSIRDFVLADVSVRLPGKLFTCSSHTMFIGSKFPI